MADAIAVVRERRQEIATMIAAREGKPGYKENVAECKTALREIDELLAKLTA